MTNGKKAKGSESGSGAGNAQQDGIKSFLVALATDPARLGAFIKDPDGEMEAAGLDPSDRQILKSGNPAAIHARIGCPPVPQMVRPQMVMLVVEMASQSDGGEEQPTVRALDDQSLLLPPMQMTLQPITTMMMQPVTTMMMYPVTTMMMYPMFPIPWQLEGFAAQRTPAMFPQVQPQIVQPQIHPQIVQPQIHPQIVYPQIFPQIHPQIVQPQIHPQIVYPQIFPQIHPQVVQPQIHPQIVYPQIFQPPQF